MERDEMHSVWVLKNEYDRDWEIGIGNGNGEMGWELGCENWS
jgi:hypothetical protein